jgi:2'-hydroxyisoflavone reductase
MCPDVTSKNLEDASGLILGRDGIRVDGSRVQLLILGGTKFLGRAIVEAARARGHGVTLFNRGVTNPNLFAEVEKLRGDRDGGLDILRARAWDAVIDTCGYLPRVVRQSVDLIESPYYLFVSTRSVYADLADSTDEHAPLHGDVDSEDVSTYYGELKAMCERVVRERPGAIVRPGLIVGPHDPSGRFTYWPHRVARGGAVLAPGTPNEPVTWIDVRDLAEWIVRLCERQTNGVFNAVAIGTWGELLNGCVRATGSTGRLVWVPSEWLVSHDVGEWMELPLWVSSPESLGIHRVENRRGVAAGLTFRPLEETIRATLAEATPTSDTGLDPAREAALVNEWTALQSGL